MPAALENVTSVSTGAETTWALSLVNSSLKSATPRLLNGWFELEDWYSTLHRFRLPGCLQGGP